METAVAHNGEKRPRTERGRRTRRKLLDAAAVEFGERGFHDASIAGITARAGTALGSFYTYFDGKDAVFRALVQDMSAHVGSHAAERLRGVEGTLEREQAALAGFLIFAREHREIYRIIDEAEFVDPPSWREHYQSTARRITARLQAGEDADELTDGPAELRAWAIMGMNVFLGLRYSVWDEAADLEQVAREANALLAHGIAQRPQS